MAATLSPGPSLPWAPCGWRSPAVTRVWDWATDNIELVQEAERIGYSQVWVAEAYGSDAPTVLSGWGRRPRRSGSAPVYADPGPHPGHDGDDGGDARHLVRRAVPPGPGVSGPQVSEGWHGVRFAAPAGTHPRVRRDRADGAATRTGALPGRALHVAAARRPRQGAEDDHPPAARPTCRSIWRPSAPGTSSSPARSPTAGSRCSSPEHSGDLLASVRAGARGGRRRASAAIMAGFDVVPTVPVVVTDDLEAAAGRAAPLLRALHRRDGQPGEELLQRAGPSDGLRGGGGRRSRTSTSPGRPARRRLPCPSSSSTRPP